MCVCVCMMIYDNKKKELIDQPTFSFCFAKVNNQWYRYVIQPQKHGIGKKGKKEIHTSQCNKCNGLFLIISFI